MIEAARALDATIPKVWLVGESNPYGSDPHFALYPQPAHSAGGRLCSIIMGLRRGEYLKRFARFNLLDGPKWSVPRAREAARQLEEDAGHFVTLVLLGAKVAAAFGVEFKPFTIAGPFGEGSWPERYVILPHPSGRNLIWNEPDAIERARATLREAGAL